MCIYRSGILRALSSLAALLFLAACGGGGGGEAPDTSSPVTQATAGGGTYGSVQFVTLRSNEHATIYYSLDGADPGVGASNTFSGPSPVTGIQMGAGTRVLKFFAIDDAGNREAVRTETYVIDLVSPNVSVAGPVPGPMGLLSAEILNWQSDKAGAYVVEIGGNGGIGGGTRVATGTAAANTPISQTVAGYWAPNPLWIYVTDSVGHVGSTSVKLSLKPQATIYVSGGSAGGLRSPVFLPNGLKAYLVRSAGNAVTVIDTDPASLKFNSVTDITVGPAPMGLAVTPDGSRAYVTFQGNSVNMGGISVIDTSTDTIAHTIFSGPNAGLSDIAITPDGKRAYYLSPFAMNLLDVDPASAQYHWLIHSIPFATLRSGTIAIAQDGLRAVVNWQSDSEHGVYIIDVNPFSATYNTILATPVPIGAGVAGGVAVTPDSNFAFATDTNGLLCRINLQTYAVGPTGSLASQWTFAQTPDGTTLLMADPTKSHVRIVKALDLTVTADVPVGSGIGGYAGVGIPRDGARAYLSRDWNSQVLMVPLR